MQRKRLNLGLQIALVFVGTLLCWGDDANGDDRFAKQVKPILKKYCFDCHEGESAESNLDLSVLETSILGSHTHVLSKIIDAIELGEMPPPDSKQLSQEQKDHVVTTLQNLLKLQLQKSNKFPATPIRRMNRFQYNNAVIDLFDLKCIVFTLPERMMREHKMYFQPASGKMPKVVTVGSRPLGKSQMIEPRLAGVAAFPQDLRAEHGFDNRADHLSISPVLMETFLSLGQSITNSPDFTAKKVGIWDRFFKPPENDTDPVIAARTRLSTFLHRAFRRPVEHDVLDRYVGVVKSQLQQGKGFTEAMKMAAAAAIASPKFLYLWEEPTRQDNAEPVSDFELATRLSFFLWGSIPDDQLLNLAASGTLSQKKILSEQVDRMLKDRKLKRFCDSFPTQWLQLDRIISSTPDRTRYPGFYFSKYRDSMHMMLEPLLLFETVLIEDLPITQFIDSKFTYRSKLLEDAYGELATGKTFAKKGNQVTQLVFQRLPVNDRRSGGMITNAAVMTMTSGPERTKPITRGAWIAGVIFNHPPKPPPADVPPLDDTQATANDNLTLREKIKLHRERSDCKGCHEKIDPLGFALENYDAIGRWRDRYPNQRNVDSAGVLFGKHPFQDVIQFKDSILKNRRRFAKGFVTHLLSYAIAREIGAADEPSIDQILDRTEAGDFRLGALIHELVASKSFQTKCTPTTNE